MFSYKHNPKILCTYAAKLLKVQFIHVYCFLLNALEFFISKLTTDERFLSFSKGVKIVTSIKDSLCSNER